MNLLSPDQTWMLAYGAACAVAGWAGAGIAFVARRWWVGSEKQEKVNYLTAVAEFGANLRRNGMTIEDVNDLERMMRDPSIRSSDRVRTLIMAPAIETASPIEGTTNYEMKRNAAAAYDRAKGALASELARLVALMSQNEAMAIQAAQASWEKYRDNLVELARLEYEGGSHAGLAAVLVAIAETERRASEVQAQAKERESR